MHLLWSQGNAEAAIQVEKLGNQLTETYDVDILCGYSLGSFRAEWTAKSSNESVHSIQPFTRGENELKHPVLPHRIGSGDLFLDSEFILPHFEGCVLT